MASAAVVVETAVAAIVVAVAFDSFVFVVVASYPSDLAFAE